MPPPLLSTTNLFFNKLFNYSKKKKKRRAAPGSAPVLCKCPVELPVAQMDSQLPSCHLLHDALKQSISRVENVILVTACSHVLGQAIDQSMFNEEYA